MRSGLYFPAWCSGGRGPVIAGCLSPKRFGIDLSATRPAWELEPQTSCIREPTLNQLSHRCNYPVACFDLVTLGMYARAHRPRQCAAGRRQRGPRATAPMMTWILFHLVVCPYCNETALHVRRGSFTIWSNSETLKP